MSLSAGTVPMTMPIWVGTHSGCDWVEPPAAR
jgi:hypothetical protein